MRAVRDRQELTSASTAGAEGNLTARLAMEFGVDAGVPAHQDRLRRRGVAGVGEASEGSYRERPLGLRVSQDNGSGGEYGGLERGGCSLVPQAARRRVDRAQGGLSAGGNRLRGDATQSRTPPRHRAATSAGDHDRVREAQPAPVRRCARPAAMFEVEIPAGSISRVLQELHAAAPLHPPRCVRRAALTAPSTDGWNLSGNGSPVSPMRRIFLLPTRVPASSVRHPAERSRRVVQIGCADADLAPLHVTSPRRSRGDSDSTVGAVGAMERAGASVDQASETVRTPRVGAGSMSGTALHSGGVRESNR